MFRVTVIAARAWIHRRNKHKICWINSLSVCSGYSYFTILKGLAKGLYDVTRILWDFIKKEYAQVS